MNDPAPRRLRFLIIHNPHAGVARNTLLADVVAALQQAGATVTLEAAESAAEDRRLVAQALRARAFDAVVAAGGDSTIRAVASGLVGTGMPLGIIPSGTGNVLAEELRLARKTADVSRCLLSGEVMDIFPGSANGEIFLSMAGAGFDAGVLKRLDQRLKRRMGKLAYALPIARALWSKQRRFEVLIDDKVHACSWLLVMRGARYAGSFVVAPRQSLAQRSFQALLIHAPNPLSLAGVLAAISLGSAHRHPRVKCVSCRDVSLAAAPPEGAQLDGEPIECSSLALSLDPRPLSLIVPSGFSSVAASES